MTMPLGIARTEMTTAERCEFLLGVIACALTGQRPQQLFPWIRRGIEEFAEEVSGG